MPYTAEISRANPAAFIFVLDQSGSMDSKLPYQNSYTLAMSLTDTINKQITDLASLCTQEEDSIYDWFYIAAIGYPSNGAAGGARNLFSGKLAGEFLHSISDVRTNPSRIETRKIPVPDGRGGFIEKEMGVEIWIEPTHAGGTPMASALKLARDLARVWCEGRPDSYPPTIIHVTDGEPTMSDGDPEPIAEEIKNLKTNDGQCLLFNLHISAKSNKTILFPGSTDDLPDSNAQRLFRMSSEIPQNLREYVREHIELTGTARFFGYNADTEALVKFLNIGTRASNLR